MTRFIILRHGESEGNKSKIIQGHDSGYGLTKEGVLQIRKMSCDNESILQDIDVVFSSDLNRAIESAHCIIEELRLTVPCQSTKLLREVNPGILGGLSHEQAAQKYYDYYSIWTKRGDLDEIPDAEKGSCLQARAISFIQYISDCFNDKTVLVVTHAAFMRSFINTLLDRDRTTPICVCNGHIHIVSNESYLSRRKQVVHNSKKQVYQYQGFEQQYAIKCLTAPSKDLTDIYSFFVTFPNHSVPYIYCNETIDNRLYIVMQWVNGDIIHGDLAINEIIRAWDAISEIHDSFATHHFSVQTTLVDKIRSLQANGSQEIKELGDIILALHPISIENNVPVLYDLHRDNLVRTNEGWKMVDVEGVLMAPAEFSTACFIAAFIMIENPNFDITRLYFLFNDKTLDISKILMLMCHRLYIGLAYSNANKALSLKEQYKLAICSWVELAYKNELINDDFKQKIKMLLPKI